MPSIARIRRRAHRFSSVVVALLAATVAWASGWTERPPVLEARQEVAVAWVDDAAYVVGGFGADRGTLASVERWRPGDATWTSLPPLPIAVHHPAAVAWGGRLYVLGGYRGPGLAGATDAVQVFDPASATWSAGPPLPSARGGLAAAVLDGRIVAVGGARDGASVGDVAALDPAGGAWRPLASLPTPRDHLGVAVLDGTLHAVGGRDGQRDFALRAHEVYDPRRDAWTAAADLPTGRSGHGVAALGGCLYALGGEGNPRAADGMFAEVERFVATTGTWERLEPMPSPRHGAGLLAHEDRLLVVAGATVAGYGAVRGVAAFVPPPCP
jgi:N-acetylneuraminic acid mutarotase